MITWMTRSSFSRIASLTACLVFIAIFTLSFLPTAPSVSTASAATGTSTLELSGFAWSANIGWIKFNGTTQDGNTYHVLVDPTTKALTGFGWSSNIGWVQFGNPAGAPPLADYPTGSGTYSGNARISADGTHLEGWALALSNGGGWDGWISLYGTNYGVKVNGAQLSSFAWGSDVVGWVTFDGVTLTNYVDQNPPIASLLVNGSGSNLTVGPAPSGSGASKNPVTITWSSQNTTSCTGVNFNTGNATSSATGVSSTVAATKTFTLNCVDENGNTASDSVVVTYNSSQTCGAGNTCCPTGSATVCSTSGTTTPPGTGGSSGSKPTVVLQGKVHNSPAAYKSGTVYASLDSVIDLKITVTAADACVASGNWTGVKDNVTKEYPSAGGPVSRRSVYTVSCGNSLGTTTSSVIVLISTTIEQ